MHLPKLALVLSLLAGTGLAGAGLAGNGLAGRGLAATPPAIALTSLTEDGIRISLAGSDMHLVVTALGRGAARSLVSSRGPTEVVGAEVHQRLMPGVVEWSRTLPNGVEHGVDIAARPAGEGALAVEVSTDLRPRLVSSDRVALLDADRREVGTYAHLVVIDATGARLPAHMEVSSGRIVLVVNDEGARYPIVIDPLVTAAEATLLSPDGAMGDQLGTSVALTSDGARALVGAPLDDTTGGTDAGSARVFVRTGSSWALEATLLAPDGAPGDQLGASVALSSDGARALVGSRLDDTAGGADAGSARVFVRSGSSWALEATLPASSAAGAELGAGVALSADGSRAVVGAPGLDTAFGTDAGSASVFVRSGATWSLEATLLAPDGAPGDQLGRSVGISADGDRAVVGAHFDDTTAGNDAGSARIFVRTGSTWAHEAALVAPDGSVADQLGFAVAIASDGSRAVLGAFADDTALGTDAGSARVFVRSGTSWTHEASLLAPDGAATDRLGWSVALSGDGARALAGVYVDDTIGGIDAGSVRAFVRTGTSWAHDATLLAPDGAGADRFGDSVALAADGSRALLGASLDDTTGGTNAGSARVFTLLGTTGSPCSVDAACTTGFCTDGVCCGTRCGGGVSDCQACSAPLTGDADGTCVLLTPATVCRASGGPCDPAERCTGAAAACPLDTLEPLGVVCRASIGDCDLEDVCSGTSAACPSDVRRPSGAVCRAANAGGCDVAEVCDGTGVSCPGDGLAGAGTVCRSSGGGCDLEEVCTGTSSACPADLVRAGGFVCRAALSACDVPESCTGDAAECPADRFAPDTTACGSIASGPCDAPDHCAGTSADCVSVYLSGIECRAASGGCDTPEFCAGSIASCPPDAVASVGVTCRPSTGPSCDPAEVCDGVAGACPSDVNRCAETDADTRDAGPPDAGRDAGLPPAPVRGCACRVGMRRSPPPALGLLLSILGVLRRRRRAEATRPR